MVPITYLLHFLEEDVPFGDVTSDAIIGDISCTAVIRAEQDGIISGVAEAEALFSYAGVLVKSSKKEGEGICSGDVILTLEGDAKKILIIERTALNILGRMSGIATQTRKMVTIVSSVNSRCRIASTRKTCPGLRILDKKAVVAGRGDPHRMNLSDGILVKDNHLALVSLIDAIREAKNASLYKKIEVEVENRADAVAAATAGADIILLDNMTPDQITGTLADLKRKDLRDRVIIELSGGIDEDSLRKYASLDVDVISMGSLTHSVKNFSLNLEIQPV